MAVPPQGPPPPMGMMTQRLPMVGGPPRGMPPPTRPGGPTHGPNPPGLPPVPPPGMPPPGMSKFALFISKFMLNLVGDPPITNWTNLKLILFAQYRNASSLFCFYFRRVSIFTPTT